MDDPSAGNLTTLHVAAFHGCPEVVQRLVAAGADCDACCSSADAAGVTPLHLAAVKGHHEVVQLLLDAGAKVTSSTHSTALLLAAAAGQVEVVSQLLAAGASVNATSADGLTILHRAIDGGHVDVVQQLLAAGADIEATDADGCSPLNHAIVAGKVDVVRQLLAAGAHCQAHLNGTVTPLHTAAFKGQPEVVQLLLEAWGQPAHPATVLLQAACPAAQQQHMAVLALLVRQAQRLYPAELRQKRLTFSADVLAAVLEAWFADVSSLDEQRAAVRKREEDVAAEKRAVQQLVVQVAGMTKHAQQESPAAAEGSLRCSKRQRRAK